MDKRTEKLDFSWAESVDLRKYSKTRKVRKHEDPLFYDSKKEGDRIREMVTVRPLSPKLEQILLNLNAAYTSTKDPAWQRVLLLQYDLVVELANMVDREDRIVAQELQRELLRVVTVNEIQIKLLEPLCLKEL